MLETTSNNKLSHQANKKEISLNISSTNGSTNNWASNSSVGKSSENMSTIIKLTKSKKLDLTKSQKSILPKNFVKINL